MPGGWMREQMLGVGTNEKLGVAEVLSEKRNFGAGSWGSVKKLGQS